MKKLRVLHAPYETAGQASLLVGALRSVGYQSKLLVYQKHKFGYEYDLFFDDQNEKLKFIKLPWLFLNLVKQFDIFHFHPLHSLFPHFRDLPILKRLGKKIVFHFWGSEVRQLDVAKKYKFHFAKETPIDLKKEQTKREKIGHVTKFADALIVGDYELQEYVPGSIVVQQIADERLLSIPIKTSGGKKPLVIHAPTNQEKKGTRYIIEVVNRLKKEGIDFEFKLVENVTHDEMIEEIKKADLVVDQTLLGGYGIFAIESMSLGKSVVCYVRDDLLKNYPGLPIINANPDTIYEQLKKVLTNPSGLEEIGKRGREYVKKVHHPKIIAQKLIDIYEGFI